MRHQRDGMVPQRVNESSPLRRYVPIYTLHFMGYGACSQTQGKRLKQREKSARSELKKRPVDALRNSPTTALLHARCWTPCFLRRETQRWSPWRPARPGSQPNGCKSPRPKRHEMTALMQSSPMLPWSSISYRAGGQGAAPHWRRASRRARLLRARTRCPSRVPGARALLFRVLALPHRLRARRSGHGAGSLCSDARLGDHAIGWELGVKFVDSHVARMISAGSSLALREAGQRRCRTHALPVPAGEPARRVPRGVAPQLPFMHLAFT